MTLDHRIEGPPDAPVVVLSGSLGTTLELWDAQAAVLSRTFRVLRYDQPGHGRSSLPAAPGDVGALARPLLELLDGLGLDRVRFCGLSLGGAVGMQLASTARGRIERLVLACTSARFGPPEGWLERAATVRANGVEAVADLSLGRWFTARFRAEQPDVVARFRSMLLTTPAEGYAACCEAIARWDFRAELPRVDVPTLVIAGADDPATPAEHARELAAGIPGARLVVLAGAAHLANVEQPDSFTAAVIEHLGSDRGEEAV
jgi:3-oxoadipate enol-lactonase